MTDLQRKEVIAEARRQPRSIHGFRSLLEVQFMDFNSEYPELFPATTIGFRVADGSRDAGGEGLLEGNMVYFDTTSGTSYHDNALVHRCKIGITYSKPTLSILPTYSLGDLYLR